MASAPIYIFCAVLKTDVSFWSDDKFTGVEQIRDAIESRHVVHTSNLFLLPDAWLSSLVYGRPPGKDYWEHVIIPLRLPNLNTLQRFCKETVITVPNLVHTVWAVALRRTLSSPSEVVFGYLVSGRDVPLVDDIGDAVGPYFNTVLSRYDLNPRATPTLGDVLRTVQGAMTARLPFQNFSWPEVRERLVGVVDPPLPAGPVYNTIINIHRFAVLNEAGVESRLIFDAKPGYDPLAHDMELTGKIDAEEIRLALVYWSTSFTDEFASALAASVEAILGEMLADLNLPIEGTA
ncbi:hypothetical protein BDV12DRAFT_204825 [Aspergillus spectabilis]